jgi:hypothetical protein
LGTHSRDKLDSPGELSVLWIIWEHCGRNEAWVRCAGWRSAPSDCRHGSFSKCRTSQQPRDAMCLLHEASAPKWSPLREANTCSPTHEILHIKGTRLFITVFTGPRHKPVIHSEPFRSIHLTYTAIVSADHSDRPRGLRQEMFTPARTLGSWVRIPLEAWMSVCLFCVGLR